jgi:hypothetical protein
LKSYLLLSLGLLLYSHSFAQGLDIFSEIQKRRKNAWETEKIYDISNFGMGYVALKNTNFSLNQYLGQQLTKTNGRIIDRKAYTRMVQSDYSGLLFSKAENFIFGVQLDRNNAYFLPNTKKLQMGINLHSIFHGRFGPSFENNALGGEFGVNIGPRLLYRTEAEILDQNFKIEYHIQTALLGYLTSFPSAVVSLDNYVNRGITQPFNFQEIQSGLYLNWQNKKRFPLQHLRLGYNWNYLHYAMKYEKDLFLANHTLFFSGTLKQIK